MPPAPVLRAMRTFDARNCQWRGWQPWLESRLCVTSGVREGCPLSPMLFLLAMAPIIDLLSSVVSPRGLLGMLADDVAMVLHSIRRTLPALPSGFVPILSLTGLRLQLNKCEVISLSPTWHELSFRRLWAEAASGWASFDFVFGAGVRAAHLDRSRR